MEVYFMGRGNVCVHGDYEELFFVDYDNLNEYVSKFPDENGEYDYRMGNDVDYNDLENYQICEGSSEMIFEDFVDMFKQSMQSKFKSFEDTGERYGVILQNELFSIEIEDNEWSVAVKLIQNDSYYSNKTGLQARHFDSYVEGMKEALFEQFDKIGTYGGPWTHGTLTREEFEAEKPQTKSKKNDLER